MQQDREARLGGGRRAELVPDPLVQSILERIQFRLIDETVPGSAFDAETDSVFDCANPREAYKALDLANTQIWDRTSPLLQLDFLKMPRLSTLGIAYLINQLVKAMPRGQAFVNVGLWCGFSFLSGVLGNDDAICIGVDNFSDPGRTEGMFTHQFERFKTRNSRFHKMDYRDYFQRAHQGPIGVYFYDGDHAYEHQMKGIEIAEPFLAPGCYVLVDDTNDPEPRDATFDFLEKRRGQYDLVLNKPTPNNGHPTFWNGLMVLRKRP
jgi:hypothetical protein